MTEINILGWMPSSWIVIPIVYFLWVTVLMFIKRFVFKAVKRFAQNTQTQIDDIFIKAADFPLTLLIFTSGGVLIEGMLPAMPDGDLTKFVLIGFKATTIIAIVMFVDRFANGFVQDYSSKIDILQSAGGVARGFIRILVIGLGFLILLDSFGVSITPIIASLGIGSLAVALALQPTLENFFSGIQIIIDKPFMVGHFVQLESGQEGYVHKIGWRSTWIRLLQNNIIVIPNSKLVNSRILNYYYPQKEMAVLVQVGVHYGSDLEKVEKVTIEVGKKVLKEVTGGIEDFEPFIRYHTFDSSSINFSVILRCKEFVDNYLIKHEFIKQLHKRYRDEGITIPYPIRAINLDQEKANQIGDGALFSKVNDKIK